METCEISLGELRTQARKRASSYIILDMLKIIRDGVGEPTDIMKKTKISWKPMISLLEFLGKKELIEVKSHSQGEKGYWITEKGSTALAYLGQAMDLIDLEQDLR